MEGRGSGSEYGLRKVGQPYTADYRVYFERRADGTPVSPFHDIPLFHDKSKKILNMVVEVPRWTNAKFEVIHARRLRRRLRTDVAGC